MRGYKPILVLVLCLSVVQARSAAQEAPLDAATHAYEKGDYNQAIKLSLIHI